MELIDKQAVIDAIVSGTIYETAEAIKKECQNPSSDNDWIGGINEAINTIEDIDSIESGWTSIKDGLPEERSNPNTHDFEYVLCATVFGDVRPYKFGTPILSNDTHFWQGGQIMDEYVTHWMQWPDIPDKE